MIALIRVRFPGTLPKWVWTDAAMDAWMNPTIPFSLAHYWTRTSLFQADMRYHLFPPIMINDARPTANPPTQGNQRQALVDSALAEITRLYGNNWNDFDRAILVFAQATDLFGGGSYQVPVGDGPPKSIPAAVCDIASSFDQVVQEVGHTFGLNHEIDTLGDEYMSPYSCMSSQKYGNTVPGPSFQRPADARLPRGTDANLLDPQLTVGPYMTPSQFFVATSMPAFQDPNTVYRIPASYDTAPHTFRLTAVDVAIDSWPARKPILAVLQQATGGDLYFFELRRSKSYDAGLTLDGSNGAPVAVAVHAFSPTTGRVRYLNKLSIAGSPGDRDYHSFAGHFTIRLNSFEDDFSSCSLTVGGNDFWKYFGVTFDNVITLDVADSYSGWETADVSPCFMFPKAPHQFRYHYKTTQITLIASSFGYEKPNYQWFINDQFLDPTQPQLQFRSSVKTFLHGLPTDPADRDVTVKYIQAQNSIQLTFDQPFAGIHATVKVIVNESSAEVLKNLYPDRSVWTGISFDNVVAEWDQSYNDDRKACAKRIKDINDHYAISQGPIRRIDPGPRFGVDTVTLINELVATNPAVANVVINELARLGNISKLEIIKKLT